jgi:putative SOS response-associated peptidase YedK
VPADVFYEWTGPKVARRPFLLRPRKGGLIALAALGVLADREGGEIDTVAIISCDADATVAPLHDRMGGARARALRSLARLQGNGGESGARTIKPPPDDLFEAIEMHPKLNDSRRDDLGIQEPLQTQLLLLATSRPTAACRD